MSDTPGPGLSGAIAAIWAKHRDLMFARLAAIEAEADAVAAGSLDDETRAAAHRDAHKLAGALGTFGLHEGTAYARRIELALGDAPAAADVLSAAALKEAALGLRASLESRP